ncbi:class C sortase [Gleimia hominis]|uniref:Class C sortase n=1 Tax=Gleimia hominis TaxID=595468 RepID=A0ABU3I7Z5_9ACTO|nr:class C sortase [Gleimia hominis]MDT3766509.1 class C sortase [Gleimia hominis]
MQEQVKPGKRAHHKRKRNNKSRNGQPVKTRRTALLPILLAIAGILVLMYPVIATGWNNLRQNEAAEQYSKAVAGQDMSAWNKSIKEAREYNKQVPGMPILDPWLARVSKDNNPYQTYLSKLSLAPQMGRLIIPKINVDLPIYHGTDPKTLEKGIGHLYGSSLPVGGKNTHAVLTGHSGLPSATLLDHLKEVVKGESIYIQVGSEKLRYKVNDIRVVLPTEVDGLEVADGKDLLTVLTCTPYGINTHRLLVTGERAPLDNPQVFTKTNGITWTWWMIAITIICLLALLLLIYWLWRRHQRRKQREQTRQNQRAAKRAQTRRTILEKPKLQPRPEHQATTAHSDDTTGHNPQSDQQANKES